MTPVVPRIVNDISYVTRINHESSTGVVLCSTEQYWSSTL